MRSIGTCSGVRLPRLPWEPSNPTRPGSRGSTRCRAALLRILNSRRGHSTLSGAARWILAETFGDNPGMLISVTSEVQPGKTSTFITYSAVLDEIHDARVFGGIHWRTACHLGSVLGE